MFQVDVNNIHHVHSIMFCFTTFVTGNNGKEGIVMPKYVFKNDSKVCIKDIKILLMILWQLMTINNLEHTTNNLQINKLPTLKSKLL